MNICSFPEYDRLKSKSNISFLSLCFVNKEESFFEDSKKEKEKRIKRHKKVFDPKGSDLNAGHLKSKYA